MSGAGNCPVAFDAAAFVTDLQGAGYSVAAYQPVPRGGEKAKPPSYFIQPPEGHGFGAAYIAVITRWTDSMDACPDHVDRVVDYVFKCSREVQNALSPDPVGDPS